MRILCLIANQPWATGLHRASAMRRRGHTVDVINPADLLRRGWIIDRVRARSGYRSSRNGVGKGLRRLLAGRTYDVIWVGGGMHLGAAAVDGLRRHAPVIINYNNDDPWGKRDGRAWDTYLQAVPYYDLVVVLRRANMSEAMSSGARRVLRVWMTFDEVVHRPLPVSPREQASLSSDVAFLGTWMPERGPILAGLIQSGLDVSIWGNLWQKAPEWDILAPSWRGPALPNQEYSKAIQCSKVIIGLLSKGNRDLHTQRSVEVPATRTVLCAERTSEHVQLFGDDAALLWDDVPECVARCQALLAEGPARAHLAERGHRRVNACRLSNEPMVEAVLTAAAEQTAMSEWPLELAPGRQPALRIAAPGAAGTHLLP